MPDYIDYQRKMLWWLTFITVCRFVVEKENQGKYVIKKAGKIRIAIYYIMWLNSTIKITYLILTYWGFTEKIDFLVQMSIWDFFLGFSQFVQAVNMWYRKYPLYEILLANWKVQEEIYKKLGSPKQLDNKIKKNDQFLVYMHTVIVVVGSTALMIQNVADPKYPLNTYAVIPYENFWLQMLFTVHEGIYIFHIWVYQASSIILCEVFSVTYTHIISEMTQVMYKLIAVGEMQDTAQHDASSTARKVKSVPLSNNKRGNDENKLQEIPSSHQRHNNHSGPSQTKYFAKPMDPHTLIAKNQIMNPHTVVPGTNYNIATLLRDYEQVMLASDMFNKWVGTLMAGTSGSNYGQFVSDVFMMIQLLKEPGTDFMAVFFYFEDACAGMLMLFRMLILMARLYPASEDFLQAFKVYLTYDSPNKKYLLKYQKTLKIVAAKIGGYKTRPITVPKGVDALMNYYIAAAMWQRPKDRMT